MTSPDGYTWYVYDPSGKRVWASGTGMLYFYDIFGKQILQGNVYFGNRLVASVSAPVVTDRLGSVRVGAGAQPMSYLPYGVEQTSTPNGQIKFGTYVRDGNNGSGGTLGADYADQRYYNPWFGRFNTPDPSSGSNAADPASWNKYAYTRGDPVNRADPSGLADFSVTGYAPPDYASIMMWDFAFMEGRSQMGSGPGAEYACVFLDPGCMGAVQQLQVAQQYVAMAATVQGAVNRAETDLSKHDCASLFGAGVPDYAPAAALQSMENQGQIQLMPFTYDYTQPPDQNGPSPGVGAQTSPQGNIQIATNRYFFTGIDQNGASVLTNPNSVFNGLTLSQMQETILIHELLHATQVVGADSAGQNITLGNGQVVRGSAGVTAAVIANCIH